jgi:hypothetical protein
MIFGVAKIRDAPMIQMSTRHSNNINDNNNNIMTITPINKADAIAALDFPVNLDEIQSIFESDDHMIFVADPEIFINPISVISNDDGEECFETDDMMKAIEFIKLSSCASAMVANM